MSPPTSQRRAKPPHPRSPRAVSPACRAPTSKQRQRDCPSLPFGFQFLPCVQHIYFKYRWFERAKRQFQGETALEPNLHQLTHSHGRQHVVVTACLPCPTHQAYFRSLAASTSVARLTLSRLLPAILFEEATTLRESHIEPDTWKQTRTRAPNREQTHPCPHLAVGQN